MYCKNCGYNLPDDANYCLQCGKNQKANARRVFFKIRFGRDVIYIDSNDESTTRNIYDSILLKIERRFHKNLSKLDIIDGLWSFKYESKLFFGPADDRSAIVINNLITGFLLDNGWNMMSESVESYDQHAVSNYMFSKEI